MKILYLTTAMGSQDFNLMTAHTESAPNPAGQNFHANLIDSLRKSFDVSVISLCPFKENNALKNNDGFHYIFQSPEMNSRQERIDSILLASARFFDKGERPIIFFDTLNFALGKASWLLAKRYQAKRVAVVTDRPENLSNHRFLYSYFIYHYSRSSDGFVCLSPALNKLFNPRKKASLLLQGILDERRDQSEAFKDGSYLFFGGALYDRYGVMDLIKAFLSSKLDYHLVIAGHGPLAPEIKKMAVADSHLDFLGQVSGEVFSSLAAHAALNINPRPYSAKLDDYCSPSKLIEYLGSGRPILSTNSTALKREFPNNVNWIDKSGEAAISHFFLLHSDEFGKLINLKANISKEEADARFGEKATVMKLHSFLASLSTSSK